jgi:predicted nucleic acid-binding protein
LILVDSNILIDVLGKSQTWREWSIAKLLDLSLESELFVNQIAFAEVAPQVGSVALFHARLAEFEIEFVPFDEESAFLAGKAFLAYRKSREKNAPTLPLPDFFLGAHARNRDATILTRDPRFFRTYFPTVPLITPDKADQ